MKKKLLLIACLVIAVSILAAGTVAYVTSRVTTHNVITSGGVTIELQETMSDGKGGEIAYKNPAGALVPGQTVSKIVRVENKEADAFVRVKVELVVEKTDGTSQTEPLVIDYDTTNWKLVDGWYYYHKALAKDQVTEPLFRSVFLTGEKMDNDWQGAAINIKVTAQGVQAANNGNVAAEAPGWSEPELLEGGK